MYFQCICGNILLHSHLQMQMPPVRQAELHSDLKIQEKDELQWKKLKAEGLDENGEREAKLRRNFNGRIIPWLSFHNFTSLKV